MILLTPEGVENLKKIFPGWTEIGPIIVFPTTLSWEQVVEITVMVNPSDTIRKPLKTSSSTKIFHDMGIDTELESGKIFVVKIPTGDTTNNLTFIQGKIGKNRFDEICLVFPCRIRD